MDRGVISYIIAFIAGIIIAKIFNFCSPYIIGLPIAATAILFVVKKYFSPRYFIVVAHLIFITAGVSHAIINHPHDKSKNDTATEIRERLSNKLKEIISSPKEHAVLTAITLGEKGNIPPELKKAYSSSGAMHILALSGLHIGIIYGIISLMLSFMNFNLKGRRLKFIISAVMIIFYAYITGFSPSVQRAAIMILTYNIAAIFNRQAERYNIIAISAFIILLLNPQELFSIGFQLSFAAVIGIAAIFPVMDASFKRLYSDNISGNRKHLRKIIYSVWGIIAISVACQITTFPITFYYFGNYSPYFLLTNLAAIPIATVTLYLIVPTLILSEVPYIGEVLSTVLKYCLELLNYIVEFIG